MGGDGGRHRPRHHRPPPLTDLLFFSPTLHTQTMDALADMLNHLREPVDETPPSPYDAILGYLRKETSALQARQTALQETLQAKTREMQTTRETLLVISGALQGLQHVQTFLAEQQAPAPPPTTTQAPFPPVPTAPASSTGPTHPVHPPPHGSHSA